MKKIIPVIASLLIMLTSCAERYTSHSFFAMDTFITVDALDANADILKGLEDLVYEDERMYSRTFSQSSLYEFNKSGDSSHLSDATAELLEFSSAMHTNTDGAFSPYMGALTDLWNIKSETPQVPEDSGIKETLIHCNPENLIISDIGISKTDPLMILDLGGIAKGKSAQNCIEFLKSEGVENAVISFGGSIACIGHSAKSDIGWSIGIKNPFNTSQVIGTVTTTDSYIAVSGAYERCFEKDGKRYHHILDPQTGYPAETDIESTVVISKDGAVSDGLSTALFVMGKDKALEFYKKGIYDFEAVLILKDGSITVTDGLKDSFSFDVTADYKDGNNLVYIK